MELQITSKNIDLALEVHRYIERKMDKLSRQLPSIIETKVEIFEESTKSPQHRYVAQVTVDNAGTLLRGEGRGENLLTAVDKVASIMKRQIEHYKGKRLNRKRG
jgi:ribosomal subunit interface protein